MGRARELPGRILDALERLAGSTRGGVVLFALGIAVYAARAVAWPLTTGRDLDEYLYAWIQLFDSDVLLPWSMLFRTPATPVVAGPLLDVAGGALAEPALALLFAGSVVAWAAAASAFGPRAALLTAAALLVYPGYGAMFHELASETVLAAAFAGWALLVVRVSARPSVFGFALVGLGIALLALIRPGNAVLLCFALFPLVLPAAWRARLAWTVALTAAAIVPLAAWSLHNGLRFGEYKLARGGNAVVPFYRAFLTDRIVSPEHGPASRRLGAAVRSHLLTREPYRSYRVTSEEVFSAGSARVHEDMYLLSDEVFGWETDYSVLRDAALEAIAAEPWAYASGVLETIWLQLSEPYYRLAPESASEVTDEPETVVVGGKRLPRPSEGQLIPEGQNLWISRPDNRIREEWTSPTEHHFVFDDPRDRPRFARVETPARGAVRRPARPNRQLTARREAQPGLPLVPASRALARRRPRRARASPPEERPSRRSRSPRRQLLVVTLNALGLPADRHFVLPVAPAFVLLGAVGLLGRRSGTGRAPTSGGSGRSRPA